MGDRELLELAAKAAGYPPEWRGHIKIACDAPVYERDWNPLTDDGDALRLAVKLKMSVTIFDDAVGIGCAQLRGGDRQYVETPLQNDPPATTRRAIVEAAAEIARHLAES